MAMLDTVKVRGFLSPGGHIAWAAVEGFAIILALKGAEFGWEALAKATFLKIVWIPVALHALWDAPLFIQTQFMSNCKMIFLVVSIWIVLLILFTKGLHEVNKRKRTYRRNNHMFCGNCGKEIKVEADFCPYCGKQFGGDDSKQDDGQREAKQPSGRESVQRPRAGAKPSKKKIWIPLVLIVSLVVGYFGYQKVMEKAITDTIEGTFAQVQNGMDAQMAEQLLVQVLPQIVGNETISNFLLQFVSGEDVMDIYHAMIRHLEYEVVDVEMVEFGHYQAHVRIANLNNSLVAGRAVELFKARYNKGLIGNALQGLSDLGSDKSQLVAEILMQSSDDYYEAEDSSYWIVKDVAINIVKENGQWTPTLDFEALIYACLGLG